MRMNDGRPPIPDPARFRFTFDTLQGEPVESVVKDSAVPAAILHNSLLVCEAVTPSIDYHVSQCCEKLCIARDDVAVYVISSRDFEAFCINPQASKATIVISSGAVSLLSGSELRYVIGHEIGHWLLRHSLTPIADELPTNLARKTRYAEISADRIGIVACEEVNIAARVMLKSLSGLTDEHIRFDIVSVLKSASTDKSDSQSPLATHPIMYTRLRAVLWFSIWLRNEGMDARQRDADLSRIDHRIKKEIDSAIDAEKFTKANATYRNAEMWLDLLEMIDDGRLDIDEQQFLAAKYGQSDLEKIVAFLSDATIQGVREAVQKKLVSELETLRSLDERLFQSWRKRFYERVIASGLLK